MKKEVLMSLGIIGLLYSSTALAQSCASTPNCETLGFTETEADCTDGKILKCPFDLSKIFCYRGGGDGLSSAKPGDIYYSDGTISENVITGKTPVGVVAYNKDGHRFVVALDEAEKTWGGSGSEVACLQETQDDETARRDYQGKTNTQCLLSDTESHPAAEYCNSYKAVNNGKGSSGWYLPAVGELYVMKDGFDAINSSLQNLSKTRILSDWGDFYLSSSSYDSRYNAWVVNLYDGNRSYSGRTSRNLTRCVLEF